MLALSYQNDLALDDLFENALMLGLQDKVRAGPGCLSSMNVPLHAGAFSLNLSGNLVSWGICINDIFSAIH